MANTQVKTFSAKDLASKEFQRTNHFELHLNIPGATITAEKLVFAVKSWPGPVRSNTVIEVPYGNSKIKIAGEMEFQSSELVVRDFITDDIEKELLTWQDRITNFNSRVAKGEETKSQISGEGQSYYGTATLYTYAPDGPSQRVWEYEDVWPSSITYGSYSNEGGSQVKEIQMTLEYNFAYRATTA